MCNDSEDDPPADGVLLVSKHNSGDKICIIMLLASLALFALGDNIIKY